MTQSFSLRKIPFVNDIPAETVENENTDKVKILELSNTIDEWEREILFSENGFYSLKGKETENKTKEFINDLENIINLRISKIVFADINSRQKAILIKNEKINLVKIQMELYEKSQLREWEYEVYENAIKAAKQRAVLYRTNSKVIAQAYNTAIDILEIMRDKEGWNNIIFSNKVKAFEADFYLSLINEFIKDKDINASVFYEKYKDKLNPEDKKNIEECINKLKNNVIAYNWAKELFSYNLSEDKNEKEISYIKDKTLVPLIKYFLKQFNDEKKRNKDEEINNRNEENWKEIIEILKVDPNKSILYIDGFLSEENQKYKKEYIKKIIENKYIKTDKEKFLEVLKELYEDYQKFKKKNISDLRYCFSDEDYKIIENFKNQTESQYNLFASDYEYIIKSFSENLITRTDTIYNFIKYVITAINNYKEINKKEPEPEVRNRIIKSALERYSKKKEGK